MVCLLEASHAESLDRQQLQQIAAENNQPVTAFVALSDRSAGFHNYDTYGLSWFSPTTELPLCGHGTLAAAAVLFQGVTNLHRRQSVRVCCPDLQALYVPAFSTARDWHVALVGLSNQHTTLHFKTPKGPVSVTKLDSTTGSLLQIKFPEAKATQNLPADLQLNNTSLQVGISSTHHAALCIAE